MIHEVVATRHADGWRVTLDGEYLTHVKRVNMAQREARNRLASKLNLPFNTVAVNVTVDLGAQWAAAITSSQEKKELALRMRSEAAEEYSALVRALLADGLTFKEVGTILGISPGRVDQVGLRRRKNG